MIQTKSLVKKYGRLTAVDDLDLTVQPGEIYGFLGPNGAGKTSTIMMLIGRIRPTSGEILLFGDSFDSTRLDLRRRIGVVPEKHPMGIWSWMTAREYLEYFADLFRVENSDKRIGYLLDRVHLTDFENKRVTEYSRGMLQKLSISRALLHNPDILFLDEPISGLDPIGIKQVRDLIVEENREGRTVFISSHLLSEIEKVCHRVAIIYRGKLVAEDKMDRLLESLVDTQEIHIELEAIPPDLPERIESLPFVHEVSTTDTILTVVATRGVEARKELVRNLIAFDMVPTKIEEQTASLEDAFVAITSENINRFAEIGGKR